MLEPIPAGSRQDAGTCPAVRSRALSSLKLQSCGIIKPNLNGRLPSLQDTDMLNTAVLTGKKVVMPVRTVAVEEDGVVTDVSDYTDCSSTNEDVLKVTREIFSYLFTLCYKMRLIIR